MNSTPGSSSLVQEPRTLTPANPELKKKLPYYTNSASQNPNGDNEINTVYPHALEVCGMNSSRKGLGVFGGVLSTPFFLYLVISSALAVLKGNYAELVFLIASLGFLIFIVIAFRMDLFTYRDEPILLNRATRKAHVFHVKRNWWRPFSKWPLVIHTFNWECVHAEIGGGLMPGAVPLLRYRLYLAFTQSPKSKRVVDRFTLGGMTNSPTGLTNVWEHIRRYMEEDGPPLQAGEKLRADRKFSSRQTWGEIFPFLLPNGLKHFSEKPFYTLAMLVVFPMSFLLALSAWIAGITSRDPRWPEDILQAAGGAPLSDAEIAKLVPECVESDDDDEDTPPPTGKPRTRKPKIEDPTGGMNKHDLAEYQAKQRAHYASLSDNELESIASISTLTAPARHVLLAEMKKRGLRVAE